MIDLGGAKKVTGVELIITLADNTQFTIGNDRIAFNGVVLDTSTSVDGEFTIGAAVTGKLDVTILNDDNAFSIYNFRDAVMNLSFIGPDADDQDVTTLIGLFTIVDFEYDGSNIVLTAYDKMASFDFPCTDTADTTVNFPITLTEMVKKACTICSVSLVNNTTPIPNGSYSITKKPEQWDTMTWHDVISYCAQLGGCFAKVDKYGRLFFDWYNLPDPVANTDGGTFSTTTTPYSDGADIDGGSFDPWSTGDVLDGGTFDDYPDVHVIPAPYALTIATDDVCINGLKVVLERSDNINADENTQAYTTALYGEDGYVLTISGNPFIQTTANADDIKDYLGSLVVGMVFRPLESSLVEDPTIEAGDCAYITGRRGNTYQCFISHVTYTTHASTQISCDAEPNSTSEKTRFTAADMAALRLDQQTRRLDSVYKIAGNTNQYFWHQEIGQDTGVHITEIPQEEFLEDPTNGGANLLARSNGIAVRDGLNELASFGAEGAAIGMDGGFRALINSDSISLMDDDGGTGFNIRLNGEPISRVVLKSYSISTKSGWLTFSAPISTKTITFRAVIQGTTYSATKTSSQFPVGDRYDLGSSTSFIIIRRTGDNSFAAEAIMAGGAGSAFATSLQITYTDSVEMAKINFTGGNNILWSGSGYYMNDNQTATLSENVSEQLTGICLVWSAYSNGAAQNYEWIYQFVPKDHVIRGDAGAISSGLMTSGSYMGMKTVYVTDSTITGHANNATTMTVAGISLTNTHWVLRYVLGV